MKTMLAVVLLGMLFAAIFGVWTPTFIIKKNNAPADTITVILK